MKFASQKLFIVLAGATLLLAGCAKKPRPDPSQTAIGPQGSGTSTGMLNNSGMSPISVPTNPQAPGLEQRPNDGFDAAGRNTELLKSQAVYFDFNDTAIKAAEREKIKAVKDYLDKNPTHRVVIEGRCDWRGTEDYNLGLGDRRANSVKKYLTTLGVPADRIETVSKGSLEAAKNASEAEMAKDRRADFIVSTAPKTPLAL
jgi:peptidoglycan-associated lipoprotein